MSFLLHGFSRLFSARRKPTHSQRDTDEDKKDLPPRLRTLVTNHFPSISGHLDLASVPYSASTSSPYPSYENPCHVDTPQHIPRSQPVCHFPNHYRHTCNPNSNHLYYTLEHEHSSQPILNSYNRFQHLEGDEEEEEDDDDDDDDDIFEDLNTGFVPSNRLSDDFDVDSFSDDNYCLLYTSPSPRDQRGSRMPSSA